jgi:maltooligosyltrehalose trehalohydrolase
VRVGAEARDGGVEFRVWAPRHERVEVAITGPVPARYALTPEGRGYHAAFVEWLGPDVRYRYALGDELLPDPASRAQPDGVHGDSALVAPAWQWSDPEWTGHAITEYVISEIHIGTFTEAGTFDAAIEHLDALRDLGITAVELMPVAQFPGARNWGYDGVFPYAVQSTYGGADGLRRFVDACHVRNLSVVLDVVYNHLGPEGNVLGRFGPYFTDRYRTPWGDALNFDGRGSDEVRNYFVENARHWVDDFRIDALRLDAVHAIADPSAYPFVEELIDAVHALGEAQGRHVWVIAESANNDARLITPKPHGGLGCDAQWNDDFHHALHALITGERDHYYADFGALADLATAYREGFVYANRYSAFRGHRYGRSAAGLPGQRFVVFAQNHDQIGNRAAGDRLSVDVDDARLRLAAAATLLAPFLPLLFMGEEWGATNPFPYFVDHGDPALVEAVRRGRRAEFAAFHGPHDPPDPAAFETFASARLDRSRRDEGPHKAVLEWHRDLLTLRRERAALQRLEPAEVDTRVFEAERVLVVTRVVPGDAVVVVLGFDDEAHDIEIDLPSGTWDALLDSHGDTRLGRIVVNGHGHVLHVPGRSTLVLGAEPIA